MVGQVNAESGFATSPPDNLRPSRRSMSRGLAESALPATGVVGGIMLITGPIVATVVRSVWAPFRG